MERNLSYTSSIKDMPLMFAEMKRTALLLSEGKTSGEILALSADKNIYQLDKEKRRREVPLRMLKRLEGINQALVNIIAHGREYEARLIAFLAFMKADSLLFEFMREVYADRYHAGHEDITDKDFLEFIERKAQNSEAVAKWTASSLKGIRGKIKSSLCEAGLGKRSGGKLLILRPLVDSGFCDALDDADRTYARAMLLEV